MSQNPSSSAPESRSIWNFLNVIFAGVFSCGVLSIVGSFVWTGIVNSVKLHGPKSVVVASAPATVAPSSGPALEVTLKPDTTNPMIYNNKEIAAKPGQHIKLTFDNTGAITPLPHNVIVGQAGAKDRLIALTLQVMTDPKGLEKGYAIEGPEVLAHTKLVNAGSSETIEFNVGAAGDYPYMCSFPGHFAMMNGTIKVQ